MGLFVDEYLEYLKGQLAMCDYVLLPLASDVEIMDFDSKMIVAARLDQAKMLSNCNILCGTA